MWVTVNLAAREAAQLQQYSVSQQICVCGCRRNWQRRWVLLQHAGHHPLRLRSCVCDCKGPQPVRPAPSQRGKQQAASHTGLQQSAQCRPLLPVGRLSTGPVLASHAETHLPVSRAANEKASTQPIAASQANPTPISQQSIQLAQRLGPCLVPMLDATPLSARLLATSSQCVAATHANAQCSEQRGGQPH